MSNTAEAKGEAVAGLLISTLIWGVSFPVIKVAVADIDPLFFVTLRFLIAALVVLIILAVLQRSVRKLVNNRILWILGITNAAGFVMEFFGLTLTTASNAALLVNVNIVFVAIFSAVMLKDRIVNRVKIGILIGLIGVFLTTTNGNILALNSGSTIGDLIIFTGGIVWAFSNIYNKRAVTDLSLSPIEVTESMTITTAVALIPILPFSSLAFPVTTFSVSALFYISIICTIFAFFLFYRALKAITIVHAGIVMLFEIVVAVIASYLFLGEGITTAGAFGGLLIGLSILLAS